MLLVREAVYFDLFRALLACRTLGTYLMQELTHHPPGWSRKRRRAGPSISDVNNKHPSIVCAYIRVCLDVLRWILPCCWNVGHDSIAN